MAGHVFRRSLVECPKSICAGGRDVMRSGLSHPRRSPPCNALCHKVCNTVIRIPPSRSPNRSALVSIMSSVRSSNARAKCSTRLDTSCKYSTPSGMPFSPSPLKGILSIGDGLLETRSHRSRFLRPEFEIILRLWSHAFPFSP